MDAEDGLVFDVEALAASPIREEMEYGGIRLKTSAYLERTRIPVTLDIGFGDALADAGQASTTPRSSAWSRRTSAVIDPKLSLPKNLRQSLRWGWQMAG